MEKHHSNWRHGMDGTPTYRSWTEMKRRCSAKHRPEYSRYGGRGIRVCGRWERFENFFADMGERPAGTSLDRIDNDGNYEPGNCRWATRVEQQRNRRGNIILTIDGEEIFLADATVRFGIERETLAFRLKQGWSHERAVRTPVRYLKNNASEFVGHPGAPWPKRRKAG